MAVDVTNSAIYHCIYRLCFLSGGLSSAMWCCISMGQYFQCSFGQMCMIKILCTGTSTVFTTTAITRWWPRWQSIFVALDDFFFPLCQFFSSSMNFSVLFVVRFQFLLIIFALDAVMYFFSLHSAKNNFLLPQACLQRNRRWRAFVQVCFLLIIWIIWIDVWNSFRKGKVVEHVYQLIVSGNSGEAQKCH